MVKPAGPRSLAIAGTVLVVIAVVLVFLLSAGSNGGDDTAGTVPTPLPTLASGAPAPTPTLLPAQSPFSLSEDGLVRRALRPDEVPEEEHGVLFVNLQSGDGELWTRPSISPNDAAQYAVDPTHRWIQTYFSPWLFTDRATGVSYEFDNTRWYPLAGPTPNGLVILGPSGGRAGSVLMIDLAADPTTAVAEFKLPFVQPAEMQAVFLKGEARVLIAARDPASGQFLHAFVGDVATSTVTEAGEFSEGLLKLFPLPDGGALAFTSYGSKDGVPGEVAVTRFDALGTVTGQWKVDRPGNQFLDYAQVSPDGRWLAWTQELGPGTPYGLGGVEHWPAVVFFDIEAGEVRFRAVRASMTNGTQELRWLSDSSALVVATPDGFALLGIDQTLTPLPLGPVSHFEPVPIPAPHDVSLYAYDGRVVNANGNVLLDLAAAAWRTEPKRSAPYGWSETGDEVRFVESVPLPGDFGAGGIAKYGLPVRIETPPFPQQTRVQVETGRDVLNVRAEPGVGSEAVGELSDGTVVTVAGDGTANNCSGDEGCSVASDPDAEYDTLWWIYVRAEDGLEGWVRSDFLTWAD